MKLLRYIILCFLFIYPYLCKGDVYFPDGKTPTEPLKSKYGDSLKAVVLASNPFFLSRPDETSEKLRFPPYYLEVLSVFTKSNNSKFYLVQKSTGEWGWMKNSEILTSRICMRSLNEKNPAYLKVFIKNNWLDNIDSIPYLDGPGSNYFVKGNINIFKVFYAFKRSNNYVFIGRQPQWRVERSDITLKGWIKEKNCILWDNQVAVYFDKTTLLNRKPVLIFKEKKDLVEYLQTGNENNVVGREDPKITWELPPEMTRFPVIMDDDEYVKIAWIGEVEKNRDEISLSENKSFEYKSLEYKSLVHITKKIDLLFLIDATKSMEKYFKPVSDGIINFINTLDKKQQKRFRFGFGVYRDLEDKDRAFQLISKFGDHNVTTKIEQESYNTSSTDKDYPEDVFEGIYKGVEQINWGEGHTKAVVTIGDHGNHIPAKTETDEKKVAKLLKKKHVAFYAINVPFHYSDPSFRPRSEIFNIQFQKQMQTILSKNDFNGKIKNISSTNQNELMETSNIISEFLEDIFVFSTNISNSLREFSGKDITINNLKDRYGVRVTKYLIDLMRVYNLKSEEFKTFNQICAEGWVSKKTNIGINQLSAYCLIDKMSIDVLVGLLARIDNAIWESPKNISYLIKEACENATGDPILEHEELSEYLQRIFFIPYKEISKVFKHKLKDFQGKMEEADFRKKFMKHLNKKYRQLHFIQENKIGDLEWDEKELTWIETATEEKNWWFQASSGVRYCWLPFEYLP